MVKRSWLVLLPALVAGLFWVDVPASQAAGESWRVTSVDTSGCDAADYSVSMAFSGLEDSGGAYVAHGMLSSGGLVYHNDQAYVSSASNGNSSWSFYATTGSSGTFPIPPGQAVKMRFTLERPEGTVLTGWTVVFPSCDSGLTPSFNAADLDGDVVADSTDACPTLPAARANGCPLRVRTLSLAAKHSPRRVVGRLYAAGYPSLYAGRTVRIWKVRSGRDLKVATLTTGSLGKFHTRVPMGRYYAKSRGLIVPTAGQVTAAVSPVRRLT